MLVEQRTQYVCANLGYAVTKHTLCTLCPLATTRAPALRMLMRSSACPRIPYTVFEQLLCRKHAQDGEGAATGNLDGATTRI